MPERDDSQILRSAQSALEQLALTFYKVAREKQRHGNQEWCDALTYCAKEAEQRAKDLA